MKLLILEGRQFVGRYIRQTTLHAGIDREKEEEKLSAWKVIQ